MVEFVVLLLVLAGFAGAVYLEVKRFKIRDARRERLSRPTSQRMAERRQYRGFEHDLLAERYRRTDTGASGDAGSARTEQP
jgi:hypothetical protein